MVVVKLLHLFNCFERSLFNCLDWVLSKVRLLADFISAYMSSKRYLTGICYCNCVVLQLGWLYLRSLSELTSLNIYLFLPLLQGTLHMNYFYLFLDNISCLEFLRSSLRKYYLSKRCHCRRLNLKDSNAFRS